MKLYWRKQREEKDGGWKEGKRGRKVRVERKEGGKDEKASALICSSAHPSDFFGSAVSVILQFWVKSPFVLRFMSQKS